MAINSRYLDRRTCDRYLEKGLLDRKEFEQFLKSLPDESANAQWVEMDLHDAEMSADEMAGEAAEGQEEAT